MQMLLVSSQNIYDPRESQNSAQLKSLVLKWQKVMRCLRRRWSAAGAFLMKVSYFNRMKFIFFSRDYVGGRDTYCNYDSSIGKAID